MGDEVISAAEFATWLTPAETYPRIPGEYPAEVDEVFYTHLALGEIRAVAQKGKIRTADRSEMVSLHAIDPEFWSADWTQLDRRLTVAGQITFTNVPRISVYLGQVPAGRVPVEAVFTGVRFSRADVDALWPEAESHENDARLPVPDKRLEEWRTLFGEAYPSGSIKLALQSVSGMFPLHHVTRGFALYFQMRPKVGHGKLRTKLMRRNPSAHYPAHFDKRASSGARFIEPENGQLWRCAMTRT